MQTKFVEVTNGPLNWGKFLLAKFDHEWEYRSIIDGRSLIGGRGWSSTTLLVLDLQTGEGSLFNPGGYAKADLEKHRIWVCPMFEPFLTWLWRQPDPLAIPNHVDLPDAEFQMTGYRRAGGKGPLPCGCHCAGGCCDPYAPCASPCLTHIPFRFQAS